MPKKGTKATAPKAKPLKAKAKNAKTKAAKSKPTKAKGKIANSSGGRRKGRKAVATKVSSIDHRALTYEEQEALSKALSHLSEECMQGAIEILKNAAHVKDDDDDVDLDIEELDTQTQRELQRYTMKHTKVSDISSELHEQEAELSHEEQDALSEAIGGLPENLLQGVVEILQNAGAIPIADDIELDLELEELDTSTLREMQRFVHENAEEPTRARRVSGVSASDEDGVSRDEFEELFQMIQSAQNDLVGLHRHFSQV